MWNALDADLKSLFIKTFKARLREKFIKSIFLLKIDMHATNEVNKTLITPAMGPLPVYTLSLIMNLYIW